MPRAARAILAIACSAGALRPDVGLVAYSQFEVKNAYLERESIDDIVEVGIEPGGTECGFPDCHDESSERDSFERDSSELDGPLPEAIVMAVMTYAGTQGRQACRSSREQCDRALYGSLQMPEFPVTISIKQHYQFGTEQSATSTWSLEIPNASGTGAMELRTEVSSEAQADTASQLTLHSNSQMLKLWKQLKELRSDVGVHHKESGDTQVEIKVIDASSRVFLDHEYKRRGFYNKADEMLETLSETDVVEPAAIFSCKDRSTAAPSQHIISRPASRPSSTRKR